MRVVCVSDTHLRHDFAVPDGDVLVHSGDATMGGTVEEVARFLRWLWAQPHENKVFVAGNHDWLFQRDPVLARSLVRDRRGITYLEDEATTIGGLRFYGSPWQPEFCDWAFNLPRHDGSLARKWAAIPGDTQVLVTHGPPLGIGDETKPHVDFDHRVTPGRHVGCHDLRERIRQLRDLRLHACGHVHVGYGLTEVDGAWFANASICDEEYEAVNRPIVVDL